jgi:hypothetical protein
MLSLLSPLALLVAGVAMVGVVAAHLLSVQQPRSRWLPTARFVQDAKALAVARVSRPRDLVLLALRLSVLGALGVAFAGIICAAPRPPIGVIVVLDGVEHPDVAAQLRRMVQEDSALGALPVRRIVQASMERGESSSVAVGTAVRVTAVQRSLRALLDSLTNQGTDQAPTVRQLLHDQPPGLAALLLAARRAAPAVAEEADSVVLLVLSSLRADELSGALPAIRGTWPGALRVEQVAPALIDTMSQGRSGRVTVVWPDSAENRDGMEGSYPKGSAPISAIAARGASVVGPFRAVTPFRTVAAANDESSRTQRDIAWWSDGTPAITERIVNSDCVRTVLFAPPAGDVWWSDAARAVRELLQEPCGDARGGMAHSAGGLASEYVNAYADSLHQWLQRGEAHVATTGAARSSVPSRALRDASSTAAPLTRWLLVVGFVLLLLEWAVRRAAPSRTPAL